MKCRLKNKFSGYVTELEEFKEFMDCFEKQKLLMMLFIILSIIRANGLNLCLKKNH